MTQSAIESLFGDDPFFEDAYLLWPRRCSFTEQFLQRRTQMMKGLRTGVRDQLISELFQSLDDLFSSSSSATSSSSSTSRLTGQSVFSLDTRGFSPEDITVTVSGRKLEVKVAKQIEKDSSSAGDSTPAGFVRSVDLPEHIHPSALTCSLGDDGFLRIEAQVKETPSDECVVPVRFRTSLDFPLSKDNTSKTEEKND